MQIDATTFVLQLVNFVVLVWILHRFLYRPVLAAIDKRRAAIDKSMDDAKAVRAEAERLRTQFEGRLAEWERERLKARAALDAELAALRTKGLADVAQTVERERDRLAALQAKREGDWKRDTEQQALDQAASFAARLLGRVADPVLDERLVDVFAADLAGWPPERVDPLAEAARAAGGRVSVSSAHALSEKARARLARALSERLRIECRPEYALDDALVAGLSVAVGPWLLQANLRDELRVFAGGAARAA
ncbi:MAG: F0F1 ATP synthase subunit delta [Sphingomonadaceae bacterium]